MAISYNMLAPAAALVVWSLIVLIWMAATRFGAFKVAGISLSKVPPGGRGQNLEGVLPDPVNWPAHNYAHLMEQPTIFYPTIVMLALLGQGTALNVALAWAYVGFRIAHSLWQIKINTVAVRFPLFLVSTVILAILAGNVLMAAFKLA